MKERGGGREGESEGERFKRGRGGGERERGSTGTIEPHGLASEYGPWGSCWLDCSWGG